jgi:hypothetical protein
LEKDSVKKQNLSINRLLLLFLIICIPQQNAMANALPPPSRLWLRFQDNSEHALQIDGVQIQGCQDLSCLQPVLLNQYGSCTGMSCLEPPTMLSDLGKFDCRGNRCLFVNSHSDQDLLPPYIRFLLSSSGNSLISESVPFPPPFFRDIAYVGIVEDGTLKLAEDPNFRDPAWLYRNFWAAYGFTILVEVLAVGAAAWFWLKKRSHALAALLLTAALANLLSYPIAWLTIPAFGQFQYDALRKVGLTAAVLIGFLTWVLLRTAARGLPQTTEDRIQAARYNAFVAFVALYVPFSLVADYLGGIGLIPIGLLLGLILAIYAQVYLSPITKARLKGAVQRALIIGLILTTAMIAVVSSIFYNSTVHVPGLRLPAIVLLAEVFAVGFETFLFYRLGKKHITLPQSFALALLANIASFLLGLITFPP